MKINNNFIKEKIGNECMIIPTGEGCQKGVYTLNETGEMIYDLLCEGKSRDEIITSLAKEYESDISEISEFVDEYTAKLLEAKILIND